jgi:hypothetical protein
MTSDRRSMNRCPTCSGPAVADEKYPEGIRCRNSSCKHNHGNVQCPRCKAKDIAQAVFKDSKWLYTCADCENKWSP